MVDANPTNAEQEFEANGDGSFVSRHLADAQGALRRTRGGGETARRIRARLGIEPCPGEMGGAACLDVAQKRRDHSGQDKHERDDQRDGSWKRLGEASRRIRISLGKELPASTPKSGETDEEAERKRANEEARKAQRDTTAKDGVFKCMRCEAKRMICSLTYFGSAWEDAVKCTRCERSGCKYCIRQSLHTNGRRVAMLHPAVTVDDDQVSQISALMADLGERESWKDVLPVWQNPSYVRAKELQVVVESKADAARTREFLQLYARNASYSRRFQHLRELLATGSGEDSSDQRLEEYLREQGLYEDFKNKGWRDAALADLEHIPDRKSDNEPAMLREPDGFCEIGLGRAYSMSWTIGAAEDGKLEGPKTESNGMLTQSPTPLSDESSPVTISPPEIYIIQFPWKPPAYEPDPGSPPEWRSADADLKAAMDDMKKEYRQEELKALSEEEKMIRFEAARQQKKQDHLAQMAAFRCQSSQDSQK